MPRRITRNAATFLMNAYTLGKNTGSNEISIVVHARGKQVLQRGEFYSDGRIRGLSFKTANDAWRVISIGKDVLTIKKNL